MGWCGSEFKEPNYLVHHGILGQKWGIRRFQNYDGTRIGANPKKKVIPERRVDDIRKIIMDTSYDKDITDLVVTTAKGDKSKLKTANEAVEEYSKQTKEMKKELNEMFKDLNDEHTRTYYEACSEIAKFGDYNSKGVKGLTMDDISWAAYMGVFEDGQQSNKTAYSMYADEHNLAKRCNEIDTAHSELYKETRTKVNASMEEALGEVGQKPINKDKPESASIASMLADHKLNSSESPYLYEASSGADALHFNEKDRADFKEAKRIASKLDGGGKSDSNWFYLREAVEDLGMESKIASELSDSDWKKINAQISDIKKYYGSKNIYV